MTGAPGPLVVVDVVEVLVVVGPEVVVVLVDVVVGPGAPVVVVEVEVVVVPEAVVVDVVVVVPAIVVVDVVDVVGAAVVVVDVDVVDVVEVLVVMKITTLGSKRYPHPSSLDSVVTPELVFPIKLNFKGSEFLKYPMLMRLSKTLTPGLTRPECTAAVLRSESAEYGVPRPPPYTRPLVDPTTSTNSLWSLQTS
jgi:hypothetical protein